MKTRKSLAFILALVMMLTLIPASAFAASTNTVASVPTVAASSEFTAVVNLKLNDGYSIPAKGVQKIGLSLTNAEWIGTNTTIKVTNAAIDAKSTTVVGSQYPTDHAIGMVYSNQPLAAPFPTVAAVTFEKSNALVSIATDAAMSGGNPSLTIYLSLKAGKDAGEIKVDIDARDTMFSSGTYTVATVAGGYTTAKVTGTVPTIGDRGTISAAAIQIDEIALGSLAKGKAQDFKLVLPRGFEFTANATQSSSGDLTTGAVKNNATLAILTDAREMSVKFTTTNSDTVRRTLSIATEIKATSDAKAGDVNVRLIPVATGDNTVTASTDLVIAKYVNEGVSITTVPEKDLPQIVPGRITKDTSSGSFVKVILKEAAPKSLVEGRYVTFTFPKEVQLATNSALGVGEVKYTVNGGAEITTQLSDYKGNSGEDTSVFEWKVPDNTTLPTAKANEVVFKIPVTVEANYAGDINLTVSGAKAGITETKVVVGKAVAPITAELVIKDVRTGVQNQTVGDIVLKENYVGAFRAASTSASTDGRVDLWIDDNGQSIGISEGKVSLTKGDLELREADGKDIATNLAAVGTVNGLRFNVKNYSVKTPGEVTIKDVKLTLNRTPAEGKYKLKVGGTSLVDNTAYRKAEFSSNVTSADYLNVATPADQGVNSSFVIGNKTYTVNGVTKEMDAAPYIDAASRTMVPIRYIGYALGLTDYQVLWNPATSTATLFGKSTVVITVGKDTLSVNGAIVPMDTKAVNKDGRIYVPARYIGNALGAKVEWDQATNTVAIYTVK